ncbi:chemotaxis protein CheA [candidate division KSB1 bacterium]|nr:MAG: chemotaxis protein CheA [candidate division KSB1 bacterium]
MTADDRALTIQAANISQTKDTPLMGETSLPTLEQIASEVILLSPDDSASRLHLEKMLRELALADSTPESVKEMAWQALVVVQGLLQAKDMESSLNQLNSLLEKMMKAEVSGSPVVVKAEEPPSPPPAAPAPCAEEAMVSEFLHKQESLLQEFESSCMTLEAGDLSALAAVKRQIHSWKGEAGILGFHDLTEALHGVENALEEIQSPQPQPTGDALLLLKDQLAHYFQARLKGETFAIETASCLEKLEHVSAQTVEKETEAESPAVDIPLETAPPAESASAEPMAAPGPLAKIEPRIFIMPAVVDVDLMQEFLTESAEHFQQAETALMSLETDPSDTESVNVVFRAFHTVKGVAGFVGISCVTEVAHKAETFFDRFRRGTLVMRGVFTDLAFEALDMLKVLLGGLNAALAAGQMTLPAGYTDLIHRLENPDALEKAAPAAGTPVKEKVGEILVREGKASPQEVEQALEKQASGDFRPVGEILVEQQAAKPVDVAHAIRAQQPGAAREGEHEGMVKVNTSRLDNLINMVGELVIAQSMVSQDPYIQEGNNQRLLRNVTQLNKITRSLQELALSMRMVSVRATFQKMARLVRDLARKSQKEILFETEGEDTELDRNMVEAIADPLVHMVRNAADHGVELPDDRERSGKPRQGRILLRAAHEGGSVIITLTDNGRGLNRQKILAKAVERGLVEPNSQLTDAEIHNLIFMPGFSTADKVTDVSGRGVGMDVVRTNVEALRGTVEISSKEGEGSQFMVRLPLTLAIIDGMVIRVGTDRFILPTIAITETFRPREEDITTVQGQSELVMLRGDLIPLSRLGQLFGIRDAGAKLTDSILVVSESKGRRIALMVDELLGQQQVVIKSLGSIFGRVEGVSGGAILGDGRISLILDVEGLIRLSLN